MTSIEANRYRGRKLPVPVNPPETICITIEIPNATEYLAAFFGALDVLGNWYAWEHLTDGTDCIDCETAAQIWRDALWKAQEGACGGETVECCNEPSITDRLNAQTANTATLAAYTASFDQYELDAGSISTIAPNMDPVNTSQSGIDQILCLGYEMLLRAIVNQAKGVQSKNQAASQDLIQQFGIAMGSLASAGGIALAIGGGAAGLVALIGGPWALLGLALAGIGTGLASIFFTIDEAALNDDEAFDEILCTMRENGLEQVPSFEMFNGLLEPNTFGENAQKLALIVQPALNDLTFFLQFMIAMSDMYATDIWSNLPECEVCPDPISCAGGEGVNFQATSASFTPYINRALYDNSAPGNGWGPNMAVAPNRISIWRGIAPIPERMKFVTNFESEEIRVYSQTSGNIGSLLGTIATSVDNLDGTFTYTMPTMTAGNGNILIDIGGTVAMPESNRLLSICWNYDL